MSKPKTYAILILDKSGSMKGFQMDEHGVGDIQRRTLNDYNEKAQLYRKIASEGGQEVYVCFVTFNEHLDEHLWLAEASTLKDGTTEDYDPNGGTALNDAIVYTLEKAQERIRWGDDDAVLVTILTEGDENSSKLYPRPKGDVYVKQLIQRLEGLRSSKGQQQWTITYVGANQDVEQIADRYGIAKANCAVYSTRNVGTVGAAYAAYNARSEKFLRSRTKGVTASSNFTSDVDGEVANWADLAEEKKA